MHAYARNGIQRSIPMFISFHFFPRHLPKLTYLTYPPIYPPDKKKFANLFLEKRSGLGCWVFWGLGVGGWDCFFGERGDGMGWGGGNEFARFFVFF